MSRTDSSVALVGTIALVGFGLLFADPLLVTAAIVPLVFALAGALSEVPAEPSIAVTREFDAAGWVPGRTVSVTVTVENEGENALPDVRIVDGVPDELAVVEGSARSGFSLSPGETATLTYSVVLKRGRFEFGDPIVRLRSLAGTDHRTLEIQPAGETALNCAEHVTEPPISDATLPHAGAVSSNTGGSGLEFFATRQYHPGDPMNRINWHHVAKTGEFVTVQYRQEHAARSVVIVDCRPPGHVVVGEGYPTGAAMAAYAGERLYYALDEAGVTTSVTAVGLDEELDHLAGPDGLPWIHSGSNESPATLFRGIHRTDTENSPEERSNEDVGVDVNSPGSGQGTRADGGAGPGRGPQHSSAIDGGADANRSEYTKKLLSRLPNDAGVILCSPVVDDWPVELASELALREYPVTVLSPDVMAGTSRGQRIGGLSRRHRLRRIAELGVRIADWRVDEPLDHTLLYGLGHQVQQ